MTDQPEPVPNEETEAAFDKLLEDGEISQVQRDSVAPVAPVGETPPEIPDTGPARGG